MASKDGLTSHDWARAFAQAWLDSDFKDKFERDPMSAIQGHEALGDLKEKVIHVPPRPLDLTDKQLEQVRDGGASLPVHNMCGFESC